MWKKIKTDNKNMVAKVHRNKRKIKNAKYKIIGRNIGSNYRSDILTDKTPV